VNRRQAPQPDPTGRRRYNSPTREAAARATRERIRASARALFVRDGYAQTSISAIARHAKVAEKTVYLAFPTKPHLLSEVIRVAVRGDDDPTPIAGRKDWLQILEAPVHELLDRLARHEAAVLHRTARLLTMADTAVAGDQHLAALRTRGHEAQRNLYAQAAAKLAEHGALPDTLTPTSAADAIFALTHQGVYLRLTDDCRWTPDRYGSWLSSILRTTLIRLDYPEPPQTPKSER
jgi:AcrR family transcriptional regulator